MNKKISVWIWLSLITTIMGVCSFFVGLGFAIVLRLALLVGYFSCLLFLFRYKGPKTEGIISCACAAIFNLIPFLLGSCRHQEPCIAALYIGEVICATIFILWIAFAIIAIITRITPNYMIGCLSLLAIVSPGILLYLDHIQYLGCTLLGFEWWHIRPFYALHSVLWFS